MPATPSIESHFPEGPFTGTLPGLRLPGLTLPKDASLLKVFKLEKDDDDDAEKGESSQTSQV